MVNKQQYNGYTDIKVQRERLKQGKRRSKKSPRRVVRVAESARGPEKESQPVGTLARSLVARVTAGPVAFPVFWARVRVIKRVCGGRVSHNNETPRGCCQGAARRAAAMGDRAFGSPPGAARPAERPARPATSSQVRIPTAPPTR